MMIPMVAVDSMSVVPVVPGSPVIAIVRITLIIPIRVIAIPIGWITKSDPYAPDSD